MSASAVRLVWTKWGGHPHWEHDALRLGEDEHGVWLGAPPGTFMSRPGTSFTSNYVQLTCVPSAKAYMASFYRYDGPLPCDVYVDIGTVPVWHGDRVTAVDLDLDVLRGRHGRVWVDDEDEFAAHRVRYAYPPEIVDLALRSCAAVQAAVSAGHPPYDGGTAAHWFDVLAAATG